jgi:DNA modification methylase
MTANKLILGDNLEKLKEFEDESIDLIYLAPPFFSNRNYEVIWGGEGEVRSFQERWASGIELNKYIFNATVNSEAEVEFFSWDFNHKPEEGFKAEIYPDKDGKQICKLQPGQHHIAVDTVDKSGLDGIDTLKLNVKEN